MFRRSKKAFSLFVACAMLLSIIGGAVDAAVASLTTGAAGKIVDVTVKYDSQSSIKIDTVVLYIDNIVYEKKKISPAKQGIVSFDWDTQAFAKGQHYLEVRLYANNKLVTAVNGAGVVSDSVFDVNPPKVSIANVVDGEEVSGTKTIRINAKDDSGEAPIVSLLVDKKLKLMQNTQPYQYNLDTTSLTDGKHVIEVYAFDLEGNQSDIMTYNIIVNNGNAPVKVADNKIVTAPVDLGTPKTDTSLASRPALSSNTNKEAGRISDNEVSASLGIKNTTNLLTGDSALTAPVMNEETTKIVLKDPVISKTVASNPVNNASGLKLASANIKQSELGLNTPKVLSDIEAINTPKAVAEPVTVESTKVLVAKKISDNNVIANELKINVGGSVAETTLNTPKTVETEAPAPKAETNVLVAKNVNNNSIANESSLKISQNAQSSQIDVNTPNIKDTAVVKDEAKPVLVAKAEAPKAKVVAKTAPASGKAKLRDIVEADKGTLFWDNKTKTVTAYVNNCKVEMKIGSKKVKVNGNPLTINLVPQLQKGRTIIDVTEFKKLLETPGLEK